MRDLTNLKDHGTKRGSALRCHRDASVAYGPHMWTTLAVQRRYDAHTACREHECQSTSWGKTRLNHAVAHASAIKDKQTGEIPGKRLTGRAMAPVYQAYERCEWRIKAFEGDLA